MNAHRRKAVCRHPRDGSRQFLAIAAVHRRCSSYRQHRATGLSGARSTIGLRSSPAQASQSSRPARHMIGHTVFAHAGPACIVSSRLQMPDLAQRPT
jgi:hypothetical protein